MQVFFVKGDDKMSREAILVHNVMGSPVGRLEDRVVSPLLQLLDSGRVLACCRGAGDGSGAVSQVRIEACVEEVSYLGRLRARGDTQ